MVEVQTYINTIGLRSGLENQSSESEVLVMQPKNNETALLFPWRRI